jgi:hypothetical protein
MDWPTGDNQYERCSRFFHERSICRAPHYRRMYRFHKRENKSDKIERYDLQNSMLACEFIL